MQMSVTFEVTFCMRADTHPGETVCIIGDCDMLGNWNPHRAVKLTRVSSPRPSRKADSNDKSNTNGMNIWKRKIRLTNGMHDYKYRYFIARIVESDSEDCETTVDVSKWETNIRQRVFSPRAYMDEPAKYENTIDTFGEYGQNKYVTNGWLIDKTEIHIRLHSNPIYMWKARHRTQTYSIKCTPLDHRFRDTIDEDEEDDYQPHTMPPQTFTKVLVSTLKNEKEKPRAQESHGEIYCHSDFMIFSARTIDPEYLGFQFDFYVQFPDKEPKHVGYSYLLPMEMKHSNDIKNLPITGLKHKPIGQIKVDYLFIKPLVGLPMTMEVSYQNYWKFERAALDIGHKGMGSSYKHKKSDAIRENTITSLQSAGSHGADFVEFDVMLSKDLIPVVYHDFHVLITYRKKKRNELENFKISVKDLSLADLQSMQLSSAEHKKEDHDAAKKRKSKACLWLNRPKKKSKIENAIVTPLQSKDANERPKSIELRKAPLKTRGNRRKIRRKLYNAHADDKINKEITEILPTVISKLRAANVLGDFCNFLKVIHNGKFPLTNIAFLLFLDVVRWYSLDNTSSMEYSEDCLKFWKVMYRLFHGKALRFMTGMKSEYGGNNRRGEYSPENSSINFAVPSHKRVATYESVGVSLPSEMKPGIINEALELKSETKSYVLSFDGKKLAPGLTNEWGDQDLFGHEEKETLSQLRERLQNDLNIIELAKVECQRVPGKTEDKIEQLERAVKVVSVRIKDLRMLFLKQQMALNKFMKEGGKDWKKSKYVYAISSVQAQMFLIRLMLL